MVYTKSIEFEWDLIKSISNVLKHNVTFETAVFAFYDPNAFIEQDAGHSDEEIRERLIGESKSGILVVVFTLREAGQKYRIISARKANAKERKKYEKNLEKD